MGESVGGTDMQRAPTATHPGAALGRTSIDGGPVSVTMVSRVCSVTMVTLVACTPFGNGG